MLGKLSIVNSTMTMIRRYSEMLNFDTFEARFEYLKLGGSVGQTTFGYDRWINQRFYSSYEWKNIRRQVIIRDNSCDLGIYDRPINGSLLIHHLNPVNVDNIIHGDDWILNPDFLITTTHDTHNAIHYGDRSLLKMPAKPRESGDTKLW